MVKQVIALFTCTSNQKSDSQENIGFDAIYDPNDQGQQGFAAATPSADMHMVVDNKEVFGFFEEGVKYRVILEKYEPEAAAQEEVVEDTSENTERQEG